jgi:D-glycero-D-manno-heptose 1,7-bisphosphate phosphatase
MLRDAARTHDLDLYASWMIGDSDHDVEAGRSAGCRTVRLIEDGESPTGAANVVASSLLDAVRKLLGLQSDLSTTGASLHLSP